MSNNTSKLYEFPKCKNCRHSILPLDRAKTAWYHRGGHKGIGSSCPCNNAELE